MTGRKPSPLVEHDPILGPATNLTSTPRRVTLAALAAGLSHGIPPRMIRVWLRSRRPETLKVVDHTPTWAGLVRDSRRYLAVSSSADGRVRLVGGVVRALLVHLLSVAPPSLGVSARSVNQARGVLAVVGAQILRDAHSLGRDTVVVTMPRLALRMGVSRVTATKALNLAVELGWLRVVRRKPGGGSVLKLGRVSSRHVELGWSLFDVVEEVVESFPAGGVGGGDVGFVAALLSRADHPVWAFDPELDRVTWLVLLADACGGDPVGLFGVGARAVGRHRSGAVTAGLVGGGSLRDALRVRGELSGAFVAAGNAKRVWEAAAEARRSELELERGRRADARAVLGAMLVSAGRVPSPDVGVDRQEAWAEHLELEVVSAGLDEVRRVAVAGELARRLVREGWSSGRARMISEAIVHPVGGVVAAAA